MCAAYFPSRRPSVHRLLSFLQYSKKEIWYLSLTLPTMERVKPLLRYLQDFLKKPIRRRAGNHGLRRLDDRYSEGAALASSETSDIGECEGIAGSPSSYLDIHQGHLPHSTPAAHNLCTP